nr:hypothetical protein Iba_chr09bCG11180 [Ipomoea batatas]
MSILPCPSAAKNLLLGEGDLRALFGKWQAVEVFRLSFLKLFCRTKVGELERGLFFGVDPPTCLRGLDGFNGMAFGDDNKDGRRLLVLSRAAVDSGVVDDVYGSGCRSRWKVRLSFAVEGQIVLPSCCSRRRKKPWSTERGIATPFKQRTTRESPLFVAVHGRDGAHPSGLSPMEALENPYWLRLDERDDKSVLRLTRNSVIHRVVMVFRERQVHDARELYVPEGRIRLLCVYPFGILGPLNTTSRLFTKDTTDKRPSSSNTNVVRAFPRRNRSIRSLTRSTPPLDPSTFRNIPSKVSELELKLLVEWLGSGVTAVRADASHNMVEPPRPHLVTIHYHSIYAGL